MKKDSLLLIEKSECRFILGLRRKSLSLERRSNAKEVLTQHLLSLCADFPYILSFESFKNEIDLSFLNHHLTLQKKLLLPQVEGESLLALHIDGTFCKLSQISCILVPGLGFDLQNHRIGYGKGHYDHFLKEMPHALKIGIGFREQFVKALPIEEHDQQLDQVLFF